MLIFLGFKEKSNFKGGNCLKGGGLGSLQIQWGGIGGGKKEGKKEGVFEASVDTQCTLWECHQLRIYLAT